MYRALRSPCPIVDDKIRQEIYQKHLVAVHSVRSCIDTSHPPVVPRLVMWRRRMNQDMAKMRKVQSANMRTIKIAEQERAKTRASLSPGAPLPELGADWKRELPSVRMELMNRSGTATTPQRKQELTAQLFSPPREKKEPFVFKLKKEVIKEDGMMVVDQRPKPMIERKRTLRKPVPVVNPASAKKRQAQKRLSPLKELEPPKSDPEEKKNDIDAEVELLLKEHAEEKRENEKEHQSPKELAEWERTETKPIEEKKEVKKEVEKPKEETFDNFDEFVDTDGSEKKNLPTEKEDHANTFDGASDDFLEDEEDMKKSEHHSSEGEKAKIDSDSSSKKEKKSSSSGSDVSKHSDNFERNEGADLETNDFISDDAKDGKKTDLETNDFISDDAREGRKTDLETNDFISDDAKDGKKTDLETNDFISDDTREEKKVDFETNDFITDEVHDGKKADFETNDFITDEVSEQKKVTFGTNDFMSEEVSEERTFDGSLPIFVRDAAQQQINDTKLSPLVPEFEKSEHDPYSGDGFEADDEDRGHNDFELSDDAKEESTNPFELHDETDEKMTTEEMPDKPGKVRFNMVIQSELPKEDEKTTDDGLDTDAFVIHFSGTDL